MIQWLDFRDPPSLSNAFCPAFLLEHEAISINDKWPTRLFDVLHSLSNLAPNSSKLSNWKFKDSNGTCWSAEPAGRGSRMQNTKQKANRKLSRNRIHRSNWRAWRWSNTLITLVTNYETERCVSWVRSFCGRMTSKPKKFEDVRRCSKVFEVFQSRSFKATQENRDGLTKLATGNY